MLPEQKLKQLQELIASFNKEELIWANGYLNGAVAHQGNIPVAPVENKAAIKKITLLYGTETGNSKSLAIQFAAQAKKHGILAKIVGTDQYRLTDLPKEENLFVVISTHGEGEPPEAAKKFYEYIHHNELQLSNTKFSVLALGDTSYPIFCKTGEDVDLQLEKFGAKRVVPLQKCDVDYESDAQLWFNKVLAYLNEATTVVTSVPTIAEAVPAKKAGKKTYEGTIVTNINLHDKGSNKETYHIEIITEEAVEFEAGDALAIIPNNKDFIVDTLLALTATNPLTEVVTAKHTDTARNLLINNLNICYLLNSTIKKYAAIVEKEIPDARVDLIDLIKNYAPKNAEQFIEVIKILSPIAPRLYTISSSPNVSNTEVHITVRRDEFVSHEDKRYGLCSNFLGDAELESKLTFYIHKNKHFKLPTADKDIIMIGPGTGIAPFRSFLQERDATGATGKNWLFFGEHHFQKDFLYQTELQNHLQTEVLHNISLAFSRDQEEKVYVQHKMLEKGDELFSWVEKGATIYLSGTKGQMNVDVENAIVQVIEQHGNKSSEEAKAYWEQVKKEGRYQKEVY
jgi:sulfite reductase (NADPH) flavoprotein alpha-component